MKTILNKSNKSGKGQILLVVVILIAVVALGAVAYLVFGPKQSTTPTTNPNQNYAYTLSYATIDALAGTSVTGTAYYKLGDGKADVSAYTSADSGNVITYWMSNTTYYVVPKITTISGTTKIQADAYKNGSITITGYDVKGDNKITKGAFNISAAAGASAKIKFTFTSGAKTPVAPLGGVLVVETNNTFTSIACAGDGVVGLNNKYQVTYGPTYTSSKYVIYELANGWDISPDNGATGATKVITCDFTNGGTAAGAGSDILLSIIPANYYIGNAKGVIVKDVEQSANSLNTRTGFGTQVAALPQLGFAWGA